MKLNSINSVLVAGIVLEQAQGMMINFNTKREQYATSLVVDNKVWIHKAWRLKTDGTIEAYIDQTKTDDKLTNGMIKLEGGFEGGIVNQGVDYETVPPAAHTKGTVSNEISCVL